MRVVGQLVKIAVRVEPVVAVGGKDEREAVTEGVALDGKRFCVGQKRLLLAVRKRHPAKTDALVHRQKRPDISGSIPDLGFVRDELHIADRDIFAVRRSTFLRLGEK